MKGSLFALFGGLLAAPMAAARYAMYVDEWHTTTLPDKSKTTEIDTVIMAFAPTSLFAGNSTPTFTPFMSISELKTHFNDDVKVMFAIGGWGDTDGFSAGCKTDLSRKNFAKNVATVVEQGGWDGVDIDWEFPGGNGADYKIIPNSKKTFEIKAYPKLLAEIRKAIGQEKLLSIATPARYTDMIAYTRQNSPKIFEPLDFINVMTYDLLNRRDNVTAHHTPVEGSLQTIDRYLALGAAPEQLNLGFAFYAKWFQTNPSVNCTGRPLGCPLVVMENADGSDNGKSGAFTFETANMQTAAPNATISPDNSCGASVNYKCPSGSCCSQYGFCGTEDAHCGSGCNALYGQCNGFTVTGGWQTAQANKQLDARQGGEYYYDAANHIFWTWDTPDLISRKFAEIVATRKIGGIMAWSLGEDSYDWSHLDAMTKGYKKYLC